MIELIKQLDDTKYAIRHLAQDQLAAWAGNSARNAWLAEQIELEWLRDDLSQEVRTELSRWREALPAANIQPPENVSEAELDRLTKQLNADNFSARAGAVVRLQWIGGNPRLAGSIMDRLKRRMSSGDLSLDGYYKIVAVRQAIWETWQLAKVSDTSFPLPRQEAIEHWLDLIASDSDSTGQEFHIRQQLARQEILDLLASERAAPLVVKSLEKRLAETASGEAASRYRVLLDLTRPALVAECWKDQRMEGEQHLFVGVPSQDPLAMRPSHFDKIDDKTAHCVSGNSLSPGDYPVGMAFPHPLCADRFFRLVNLPDARRQIAYSYHVRTSEATRLAAVSRRTLASYLAERHALTESEIGILAQLDVREVSKFAGDYLLKMDDREVESDRQPIYISFNRPFGQPSLLNAICAQLAADGTNDVVPGLLEAIRRKRFTAPTAIGPYRLSWVAAFAIAHRDPWPNLDDWLAGQVDNPDSMTENNQQGPTVGAIAAAMLLQRRHQDLDHFGLEPTPDALLSSVGIAGFRHRSVESIAKVHAWWQLDSQRTTANAAAHVADVHAVEQPAGRQ
jgi:hypothetical protein